MVKPFYSILNEKNKTKKPCNNHSHLYRHCNIILKSRKEHMKMVESFFFNAYLEYEL